jgi:uncharacterized protein
VKGSRAALLPLLLAAFFAAVFPVNSGAQPEVPYLAGRVNDLADMIPPEVEQRIEEKAAAYERETGAQVAVLTIESLEGYPIEDYSIRVAEAWELGRAAEDDGVLFLVAERDRRMRIEVGYGLEPVLTDLESRIIMDEIVRPEFQRGDFAAGIEKGVDAILEGLRGAEIEAPAARVEPIPVGERALASLIFALVVGVFSFVAVMARGCQGWFLYLFLMPFYFVFPIALGINPPWLLFAIWLIGFPILKAVVSRTGLDKKFVAGVPDPWRQRRGGRGVFWGGGFGGGGFGGGGFGGGGGFSGGGGGFGGGGSSGSW